MAFKKGISGNPDGRPKGKGNKTTEEVRKLLQAFVENKLPELNDIWQDLESKEKVNFLNALLRHTLPAPVADITQFSETDLDLLVTKLREQQNKKLN